MTSVRTVRPTPIDLAALVAYDGRVYPNEAFTRERIGRGSSPHPLETALEQWFSFATGRHTWISLKGATLRGLASARGRGSKAAWEVDCLIDASEDDAVLTSLLDRVVADAGEAGAEKVFLRVAADSPVVATATKCGFAAYAREALLAAEAATPQASDLASEGLRRWQRADAHPAFQLYNRWAPEAVRRVEAATFREWLAARERISPRRGAQQRVLERDGRFVGWLRTAADGEVGRFDLMVDPAEPDAADALVDAALARLAEQSTQLTLVPDFAGGLRDRLLDRGFEQRREFALLARRTMKVITLPQLAASTPARTSPA